MLLQLRAQFLIGLLVQIDAQFGEKLFTCKQMRRRPSA
jgi:hypothetical protein